MTANAVILDALREARFPLRAVAVVNEAVTDAELKRMDELGVRGLRLRVPNIMKRAMRCHDFGSGLEERPAA